MYVNGWMDFLEEAIGGKVRDILGRVRDFENCFSR